MNRKLFFSYAVAALLCACSANASKADASSDMEDEAAAESASLVEESDESKEFESVDLGCFELKGHVKKLVVIENDFKITYSFSKEGELKSVTNDSKDVYTLSRGDDGELVVSSDDAVTIDNYAVDDAKLEENVIQLSMKWGSDGGLSYQTVYEYDDKGNVVKETTTVEDEEGESDVYECVVKTLSTDSHGNWTSRKLVGKDSEYVVKRTIEYY